MEESGALGDSPGADGGTGGRGILGGGVVTD
jgi:hypothetical protein